MSDWREEYKRRYAELKKTGKPFFPYAVFKDLLVICLVLVALAALAHFFSKDIGELADPTDATFNPRPEWYFLFLFQMLKFFPGELEPVAAVLIPGAAILLLVLLPLLDSGPNRHPLDRPRLTALGLVVMGGVAYLTWAGFRSPLINPVVEKDPSAMGGERLFRDMKCFYCHTISGAGGKVGPELTGVAAKRSDEWLIQHLRDPQAVTPGTAMPKMNLLDEEITDLVAYMKTLQGRELFTQEAPKLFTEHCASCHRIGNEGEELGPDLSLIGSARDKSYLKRYISDPTVFNSDSAMPGFKKQLTDVEIEDLARYLASLQYEGK